MEPGPSPENPDRPRFFADEMLGRLAKWLRLVGYDTKYARSISDSELMELAESETRIILTRDTLLIRRKLCRSYIFIHYDHWRDQLREVVVAAGLDCESALTICAVCNEALAPSGRDSVKMLVPPYVYGSRQSFARCPGCLRVYWAATHTEKILDELAGLTKER